MPPVVDDVSVMGVRIFGNPGERRPLVWQQVNAVMVERDAPLFVAAVTRDVSARADLARRLPGDAVLLLFPDYATAARTLSEGELGAAAPGGDGPVGATGSRGLFIDPLRLDVTWNGNPLRLTRLERAVLGHLAEAPLRAWPYADLYHAAWGDAWLGDTSALHATV